MRNALAAGALAALVALGGCGAAGAPPQEPPVPPAVTDQDGVRITLTLSRDRYGGQEPVMATVSVRNTGRVPVPYWGADGCDPGVAVTARWLPPAPAPAGPPEARDLLQAKQAEYAADGSAQFAGQRLPGQAPACTEALVRHELPPGDELRLAFAWDQALQMGPDRVKAPAGPYRVVARFARGSWEQPDPMQAQATVTLAEGAPVVGRYAALAGALAHPQVLDWYRAHTGGAVVRLEGGEWLAWLPEGWVKVTAALAEQLRQEQPSVGLRWQDGRWEVRLASKYGPAPRELFAVLDGATGRVLQVGTAQKPSGVLYV